MEVERIIEKIKSLFNLAKDNGASKTEAENAIKAAQKLISRSQLENLISTELDIEQNYENYEECIIYDVKHKNRINWREKLICSVCEINGCQAILRKEEFFYYYTCFGKKENIKICKNLLELIIPQVESLSREDKREYELSRGIRKRGPANDSFKLGCVERIIHKLNEAKDDEINSYIKEKSKISKNKNGDDVANALILTISNYKNELEETLKIFNKQIALSRKKIKKSTLKTKIDKIDSVDYDRGIEAGDNIKLNTVKILMESQHDFRNR